MQTVCLHVAFPKCCTKNLSFVVFSLSLCVVEGICGEYTVFSTGTTVFQLVRCCATNREVAGSIPDGLIGISH